MQLTSNRSRRIALAALLATAASVTVGQSVSRAGGHSHGPIYRTLDALAGGIEAVIDVATAARERGSKCDDGSCDDGCDEGRLHELQGPSKHDLMMPPALPPSMSPTVLPTEREMTPPNSPLLPLPSDPPMRQVMPSATPEDEWLDSFSPETVRTPIHAQEKRGLPIPPPSKSPAARRPEAAGSSLPSNALPGKLSPARPAPSAPRDGQYRGPAETFDSLPDPFIDDSQSQRPARSATRQVGYWDAW